MRQKIPFPFLTVPRLIPGFIFKNCGATIFLFHPGDTPENDLFLANCLIINSFYVILSLILEWCTLETARLNLSHLPCRHAQDERFLRSARPSRYSYRHEMQGVTTTKNKQMYNLN